MADPDYILRRPGDAAEARRGIACLMGGPESPGRNESYTAARVESFVTYSSQGQVDILRQVQAVNGRGELAGMCLWAASPGRTAMLFGPNLADHPQAAKATGACVQAALEDAASAGVVLVQAMVDPQDALSRETFANAGLMYLATLTYMERRPPLIVPSMALPAGVTLEAYSAATHELFKTTIQETYQDTLDCPALSNLRDMEDVIAGHKAVGPFDGQLWSVVREHGVPRGVLLLGELTARNALELVYLGLVPAARGKGLGKMLMNRVLAIASRRAFALTSLAVDAANVPAAKLYRRCGFSPVADRQAFIRKLR